MMDLHEWLTFGNTTRTHQGTEGPPREPPSLPLFHIEISLREMRESFVEAPPCHTGGRDPPLAQGGLKKNPCADIERCRTPH